MRLLILALLVALVYSQVERPLKHLDVYAYKIHDNCDCEFFW
jgi:hypothetical protein